MLWLLMLASCILIKYFYFVRSNSGFASFEIVIEDSEVFYLFLLAKK